MPLGAEFGYVLLYLANENFHQLVGYRLAYTILLYFISLSCLVLHDHLILKARASLVRLDHLAAMFTNPALKLAPSRCCPKRPREARI